jgi:hypothetical protein
MRSLLLAGALTLALAAPAFADTLKEVTTKGVVMSIQGMDIPIAYKPDGTFAIDVQGQSITGKWRIDGAKLCTTSSMAPEERCTEYPKDKKSGDSFEVTSAMGSATIKIN